MEVLTLEVASSVDAKVEARFTADSPRTAQLYVNDEHIGAEQTGRSFPAGNVLPTRNVGQDLGRAIDGAGPVGQLSLTSEQASQYRNFRSVAEGSEECAFEGCHRAARMVASAGPACQKHYDELS